MLQFNPEYFFLFGFFGHCKTENLQESLLRLHQEGITRGQLLDTFVEATGDSFFDYDDKTLTTILKHEPLAKTTERQLNQLSAIA
jgi:hypothetical protein